MGKQKAQSGLCPTQQKYNENFWMIGARLRISDVETCNTSVFWIYCMLEQAVSPNIQQLGGIIYFCTR